jgi:hypothetical protein
MTTTAGQAIATALARLQRAKAELDAAHAELERAIGFTPATPSAPAAPAPFRLAAPLSPPLPQADFDAERRRIEERVRRKYEQTTKAARATPQG